MRSLPYRRRFYRRPAELLRDLALLARNLRPLLAREREGRLPAAFRERLMLVVTGVNRCRYCAAFHTRLALRAGISREEVRELLAALVQECPADEIPALLYARSWAEREGEADEPSREALRRTYGATRAVAIEAVLHSIRVGNLLGNSWDYLLCRLTRGRIGCDPPPPLRAPAPARI